ncbi:CehA/McbA family metallohydrolase [Sphingomonas kyeonggiensis]|uniref:PHP domain-containing protein n=1 Tax=Sphingomonas kyeonggiensis TaxID=1268553 RepID=A0A7W6NYL5_9SPHN|nr:CehA/McbA family metallohydrolase [Sphingomonas kyeonggiensis]MBB4100478.1 hypothetical protein [Sphingomonas kyeonggiensis]
MIDLLALFALAAAGPAQDAPAPPQDVVITGTLEDKDRGTYRELPFDVPQGVTRMMIDVEGADHDKGVYLVLGVYDPQRERGWGGAIKPHIILAETFASPSYLAGPLTPGKWRLSIAVAYLKPGVVAPFKVTVHFDHGAQAQVIEPGARKAVAGWYSGDFHVHTGNSDAVCRGEPNGKPVPCPTWFSLKAAHDHHLDFVVVTDHNTRSQYGAIAEEAPFFDELLVIPGREMTTQYGHYNLIGVTDFVEYRVGGAPGLPNINAMFEASRDTGALVSINHPEIPTGENCLGCGWSAPDTDFARVNAIEVANGGIAADHGGAFDDGANSGTAWWEDKLNQGFHLTGIGGSDNHDPIDGRAGTSPVGAQSPVGTPATIVYAMELSQAGIRQGILSGRAFIDLEGVHPGRVLDLSAHVDHGASTVMGGTLSRPRGKAIQGKVTVKGGQGNHVDLIVDGRHLPLADGGRVTGEDAEVPFTIKANEKAHWFRADLRAKDGRRVLIGNPIYISE